MLPYIRAKENKTAKILNFSGLDLRCKANPGTLSQEENISADSYPALSPRKARRTVTEPGGISLPVPPRWDGTPITDFTGIKDNRFYYRGKEIKGELTDTPKSVADFSGKICIFPDKLFYDYTKGSDSLESMEKTLTVSGVKFYSSLNSLTGEYTAYVSKTNGGFDGFKIGDSIVIEGCSQPQNNTFSIQEKGHSAADNTIVSAVVNNSAENRLDLLLFTKNGEKALFKNTTEAGDITIKVSIPQMNNICVHNNRLWGTSQNGDYIYASKLGDCTNFNSFQGLSDDSWYSMIGTPGKFTGICSYRSSVVAFKQQCIHHVYGDSPSNFSIPKQTLGGCIDGRSIAELSGVLYYLAPKGFYAYDGGEPYCVSFPIINQYTGCVSGTDGKRYFGAAYKTDGTCDVLVYDPYLNLWHREDNTPFVGFFCYGTKLYGATEEAVYETDTGENPVKWSFTTQALTYNDSTQKGLNCIYLQIDKDADTQITISVSHDGGEFIKCASLPKGRSYRCHRIPVRFKKCDSFKIRAEGEGNAVIHNLELVTYQGGKNYE